MLFVSICFYFHFPKKREEEEKDVVLALCCVLKVKTKKSINQDSFIFTLFSYDVSSMSIALDNQLRQKEKNL